MTFDRLIYIDRLKEAGVAEAIARAHAEALRDALFETVATKADVNEVRVELKDAAESLNRKVETTTDSLDRKIEITARDLTIKGAAA